MNQEVLPVADELVTPKPREVLDRLTRNWPHLFDREDPKPLAVGIHKDIRRHLNDVPPATLSKALNLWVLRVKYHYAVSAAGAVRHNLDGTLAGEISEKHKERAALLVAKYEARQAQKAERNRALNKQRKEAMARLADK